MTDRDVAVLVFSVELTLVVIISWLITSALVSGSSRERMIGAAVLFAVLFAGVAQ